MLAWLCRLTCLRLVAKFRRKIFGGEKKRINYPIDCLHRGHSRASLQPRSAFSTGTAKVFIQNIWAPVCHLLLKSLRRQIKITKPPPSHLMWMWPVCCGLLSERLVPIWILRPDYLDDRLNSISQTELPFFFVRLPWKVPWCHNHSYKEIPLNYFLELVLWRVKVAFQFQDGFVSAFQIIHWHSCFWSVECKNVYMLVFLCFFSYRTRFRKKLFLYVFYMKNKHLIRRNTKWS